MSKYVDNSTIPRIFTEVVDPGYCCGCGVSAGPCSKDCLKMRFNRYGGYNSLMAGNCVANYNKKIMNIMRKKYPEKGGDPKCRNI